VLAVVVGNRAASQTQRRSHFKRSIGILFDGHYCNFSLPSDLSTNTPFGGILVLKTTSPCCQVDRIVVIMHVAEIKESAVHPAVD